MEASNVRNQSTHVDVILEMLLGYVYTYSTCVDVKKDKLSQIFLTIIVAYGVTSMPNDGGMFHLKYLKKLTIYFKSYFKLK